MMKKMVLSLVAVVFLGVVWIAPAKANSAVHNGIMIHSLVLEDRTFTGKVINNRTYVDLFGLLNCLPFLVNAKGVSWEPDSKTLSIYPDLGDQSNYLQFQSERDYFIANGEKVELGSEIILIKGRIYLPLKSIADYYQLAIA
ncbi:copper amine oxidase N-terminal domain-containing protein [Paenibacillus oenotherae]|uniref:Copper amine oxidase N-terminal domain-containing protein n=1 Tax=Paenibacillus oenotherae TaxID=1435645 RepID=A0ABS7D4A2_9BACL|nr:stalk domain-containing protein [Paenibacillus oenotherae]MBW7474699.1 copper amine oxidase N-terminal domain-containing protein [Paenibacillus oenotherae]